MKKQGLPAPFALVIGRRRNWKEVNKNFRKTGQN
jgi:hypothetical protein